MFFAVFAFYIVFGSIPTISFLKGIKTSARDIAMIVMGLCVFLRLAVIDYGQAGVMFFIVSIFALVMDRFESRNFVKKTDFTAWLQPLSLGVAVIFSYAAGQNITMGEFGPFEPVTLVLASIILLILTVLWHYMKREKYKNHTFYVSQGFY